MDLSTGPGLVAAVGEFLNREDLTAQIPAFVRLAEAAFNRELRLRDMLVSADFDLLSGETSAALPANFLEARSVRVSSPPEHAAVLTYADPDTIFDMRFRDPMAAAGFGLAKHYSIIGNNIELAPKPAAQVHVQMQYYARIPALDVTTPGATSWLLTRAPDLYLYGTLISSAPYLAEDERIATWTQLAVNAVNSLNLEAEKAAQHGSRLNARIRAF